LDEESSKRARSRAPGGGAPYRSLSQLTNHLRHLAHSQAALEKVIQDGAAQAEARGAGQGGEGGRAGECGGHFVKGAHRGRTSSFWCVRMYV